ncbi:family 16 glycoside hydrolase [Sporocytophaga myxococcoides]|uniref:family 16 glycoside hydrolase n=1 Tax=Sporocytophaga myxococcoides TaxID=153721 RepID=UPI00040DBA26|nr:family 16 glycoside hydrolase [Sporocytophaga myxococcoides]
MELITFGDKSLQIVNGKVVMALSNSSYMDGILKPLTKGRIQLQSEAAEVFFKDIKIKPITKLPSEYADYF